MDNEVGRKGVEAKDSAVEDLEDRGSDSKELEVIEVELKDEDEGKGVEVMAVAGMELGLNTGATEMMSLLEAGVEAEKVSSS